MNKLLAKVDSDKVADERLELLGKQYSDYKFGKNRSPGETRTEILVQGVRTGVNFTESVLANMKRIAQGIIVSNDKPKSQAAVAQATKPAPVPASVKETAPATPVQK
jgi:hypothetical protein